jgi:uncharacterized protein YbjQ (UPF0145 family)
MIPIENVSTGLEIPGFKVVRSFGVVRGLTVRSRNICCSIGAVLCACAGGRNEIFIKLCEQARDDAMQELLQHAEHRGANAVIGMRYDTHDIMDGVTEVLAYGTAVLIETAV